MADIGGREGEPMRENTFADDSLDRDDDDLVSKRTELPDEPYIWELRTPSTPEWEDTSPPPPKALPAEDPSEEGTAEVPSAP